MYIKCTQAHFVHYRQSLGSVRAALADPSGLAVLGMFFVVGDVKSVSFQLNSVFILYTTLASALLLAPAYGSRLPLLQGAAQQLWFYSVQRYEMCITEMYDACGDNVQGVHSSLRRHSLLTLHAIYYISAKQECLHISTL